MRLNIEEEFSMSEESIFETMEKYYPVFAKVPLIDYVMLLIFVKYKRN